MTDRRMDFDEPLEPGHPPERFTHNLGSREVTVSATRGGKPARVRHEVLDENTVSVEAVDELDLVIAHRPDPEPELATEPLG